MMDSCGSGTLSRETSPKDLSLAIDSTSSSDQAYAKGLADGCSCAIEPLSPQTTLSTFLSDSEVPNGSANLENAAVSFAFTRSEDKVDVSKVHVPPEITAASVEHLTQNIGRNLEMRLGESFTCSVSECTRQLTEFIGDFSQNTVRVSQLITAIVSRDPGVNGELHNPLILYQSLSNVVPDLDWDQVVDGLDNPHFIVNNPAAFKFLTTLLSIAFDGKCFPTRLFYTPWKVNKQAQFLLLVRLIAHPNIFDLRKYRHTLANVQCLKIPADELSEEVGMWRMVELVDCLLQLGENTNLSQAVFNTLKPPGPMHFCPDVLALTLCQLPSDLSPFRLHTLKNVTQQLISGHQNAIPVLNYVWNSTQNSVALKNQVLSSLTAYYTALPDDQNRLARVLEVAHELKPNGLAELFSSNHYAFVIDLACLAARRDFLKLDKFLDDKLNKVGEAFAQHLVHFMRKRMNASNLPSEVIQTLYGSLYGRQRLMPWLQKELAQIPRTVPQANLNRPSFAGASTAEPQQSVTTSMDFRPQGRDTGPGGGGMGGGQNPIAALASAFAADDDLSNAVFSEAVQEEANTYFQRIYDYNNPLPVHDFLRTMKRFSASNNPQDKELLSCLLKNLFDEFKFFAEYPERELRTTAKVYGGIIREGIVVNMKFATAIRRILEALQGPRGSLLNIFGIVAINECRACLHKYTKICQMVSCMDAFQWFQDDLKEYIQYGMAGQLPPSHVTQNEIQAINENARSTPQSHGQATTPVAGMRFAPKNNTGQSLGVTNADTLVQATRSAGGEVEPPDSQIEERISFLCNNLSLSNLPSKCDEMKDILRSHPQERLLTWLAQYIVMKRVTIEANLQNLYNSFLMALKDEQLDSAILAETYRCINILLRSDMRRAASNFADRQLLKNLGYWLGFITIARDEPILHDDLNIKGLLMDAFYRGQHELLYVVPFVTKVMQATLKSVAFSPRCTWIHAIVKVLAEIHDEPDLKLNLKFEIEVMCKDLQIELKEVEKAGVLKDSSRLPSLYPPRRGTDDPSPINSMGFSAAQYRTPNDLSDPQRIQNALQMPSSNMSASASSTPPSGAFGQGAQPGHGHLQQSLQAGHPSSTPAPPISQQPGFMSASGNPYGPYVDQADADWNQFMAAVEMTISHLHIVQIMPHLKVVIRNAIGHAVKELVGGITDRAISVAITATVALVTKDFAMNSDEQQMRRAAQQVMRNMTAGMAMITSRDPLSQAIQGYLRQAFITQNNQSNQQQTTELPKPMEDIIAYVAEQSIDTATNYVVKCACEKAIQEVERRMEKDFQYRRQCRQDGRPFKPDTTLIMLNSMLPDPLKRLTGPIDEVAFRVYEDFHKPIVTAEPPQPVDEDYRRTQFADRAPSVNPMDLASRLSAQAVASRPRPASVEAGQFAPHTNGNDLVAQQSASRQSQPNMFVNPIDVDRRQQGDDFQSKVESILREWINMCYQPNIQRDPQPALATIVNMMRDNGILVTDEMITKFFKVCADICFDVAYRLLRNENQSAGFSVKQRCYFTLDAFVKLTCLMIKYSSDSQNHATKLNLLRRVLGIITQAVGADHDSKQKDFNGMPFMRIIIQMFNELTTEDASLDPISWEIVECFCQALFLIQPRRVPGFVFHWLEIIGHRTVLTRLFQGRYDFQRASAIYIQLLVSHLRFLGPFLRSSNIQKNMYEVYKGTLRIMFVILHDFPEILCEYHYVLCDVIQPNCIQLRNLVLSAYPKGARLPDPFTQTMEMLEQMPEMNEDPKLHREMSSLVPANIRQRLDEYLRLRVQVNFLAELPNMLAENPSQGCRYNISTVNAVVVHVGTRAIDHLHEKSLPISMHNVAHTAFMDIFQNLVVSLCTQGRYLLFNAIANQLRYPNSHTSYFSCVILYLFLQAHNTEVQEQITRILFERLVAMRPHPWGLLITFIELIRNPQYQFWKHEFTRCAPEIERLFLSVASSCNVQAVQDQAERLAVLNLTAASRPPRPQ